MKTRYFISSGRLNRMYTLRSEVTTTEFVGNEPVTVQREYHLRNLSTDLSKARSKADAYLVKSGKTAATEVGELDTIHRGARDPRIIYFGKYQGSDISVMPDDYAVFVYGSMSHAQFPAFWEQVATEFADAFAAARKARKAEARREARARAKQAAERQQMLERAIWIDASDRITVTGTIIDRFSFQTTWGYSTISKCVDDAGVHYLYWNYLGNAKRGDRVTFECRVKEHDFDRDDQDLRVNVITRATKVKIH